MLLKLLTAVLLFGTLTVSAQQTDAKKTDNKPKETPVKIDYHQVGSPMPPVKLVTVDTFAKTLSPKELKKNDRKNRRKMGYAPVTKIYTENDLDNGETLFMMMFNPTCGHCEQMTDVLEKNIEKFKNSQIVMIANPIQKTYFADFITHHKVRDYYPHILIGVDSGGFNDNTYLYSSFPQFTIYSKERKLLKIYNGEVSVDSLVQFIK